MFKKISLVVVMLFALIAFSVPAMAVMYDGYYGDDTYLSQGQFGINLLVTGLVINPVDIGYNESESCGEYGWGQDFGFYWGGMSIDVLAVQAIGQSQSMGTTGYGYVEGEQHFRNAIILQSPGFNLMMMQESSQYGYSSSDWYWGW